MLDRGNECAVLRVYIGSMADDFGEAHVCDVFSSDNAVEASIRHPGSAEAREFGVGDAGAEFSDDLCAVVVARGFASGEKDARVGVVGDGDKFSLSIWR